MYQLHIIRCGTIIASALFSKGLMYSRTWQLSSWQNYLSVIYRRRRLPKDRNFGGRGASEARKRDEQIEGERTKRAECCVIVTLGGICLVIYVRLRRSDARWPQNIRIRLARCVRPMDVDWRIFRYISTPYECLYAILEISFSSD